MYHLTLPNTFVFDTACSCNILRIKTLFYNARLFSTSSSCYGNITKGIESNGESDMHANRRATVKHSFYLSQCEMVITLWHFTV